MSTRKALGGTTTEAKSYQHTAKDLPVGMRQFRLTQVDLDDTSALNRSNQRYAPDAEGYEPGCFKQREALVRR